GPLARLLAQAAIVADVVGGGARPHRHVRLGLQALARPVLSRENAGGEVVRVLRLAVRHGRAEQLFLPTAVAQDLRRLAGALAPLRRRNVALCVIDTPRWPSRLAVTADFVYVRFHGPAGLYASKYTDAQLREWAERIRAWREQDLDVFAYFNNDANAFAVFNAFRL